MRVLSERRRALAAIAATALVVSAATAASVLAGPQAQADTGFAPGTGRPFSSASPFNDRIGSTVRVDPNSSAMIATMTGVAPTVNVYDDVPPIYDAPAGTVRHSISCTMSVSWGPCAFAGQQVPIPAGAVPSSGSDDNMVVVDWSNRKAYEFWQYRGDRATTSWGEISSIDGNGNDRFGATGSGISRLAGIIRTYEARRGYIPHALVGATGNSCQTFRYPATRSDGWSTAAGCIPEGARVQLDPAVNCSTLPGAKAFEKMVCRAMQEYGWYNIDNGNARGSKWFNVQFENPAGESNPYPGLGVSWDHMAMTAIPFNRLRVLASWNAHSNQVATASPTPTPTPTPVPSTTPTPTPTTPSTMTTTSTTTASPAGDRRAPTAPRRLQATARQQAMSLTWTAATDDVGVTLYEVSRTVRGSTAWAVLGEVRGSSTSFVDQTVASGTRYTYRVRARDAAGNVSAYSDVESERA